LTGLLKPQHFAVLAGSLLLIALVLIVTGRPQADPAPTAAVQPAAHVITVAGDGEVRVRPDLATISFGVLTNGASAAEAEALNVASVQRVRDALVAAGVDEHGLDITRKTLNATTFQDFAGATRVAGYQAQYRISGSVKNPAKVQAVVDAALAAGATSLEGVVYTLESPEASRQAATQAALDSARARATALVRAEGGRLGDMTAMEVIQVEAPPADVPTAAIFRARVRASFGY
jgi:uncharacterized protein YggE